MNTTEKKQDTSKKILWLSDSPTTVTGYANDSINIMNGMVERGWSVDFLGHNYLGQMLKAPITFEDGYQLKFNLHGSGREQYCKDKIIPYIHKYNPDIFGIHLDTFMLFPWLLEMPLNRTRSVFYFPSDGAGGLPLGCEQILKKMNYSVAMSKFAQKQAKEVHGVDTGYIPAGIKPGIFFPLEEETKKQLKAKYGLGDKFVVGSVFRNQGRKMADLMVKAFAVFAKDKDDVILFMHSDPNDVAAVSNLQALAHRLGILNKIRWSGMNFYNGFTTTQMNEVYNIMDVFTLSTSGEGFGIPTVEAMACGIPVVIPDNTTAPELVMEDGQAGLLSKSAASITGSWNVERDIPDINDLARCYQELYDNPDRRKEFGKNGIKKVAEKYTWEVINKQWNELFEKMRGYK